MGQHLQSYWDPLYNVFSLTCKVKIIVFWLPVCSCPVYIGATYWDMGDSISSVPFTRICVISLHNNCRNVRLKPLISSIRKSISTSWPWVLWDVSNMEVIPEHHHSSCKYRFLVSCFPAGVFPEWLHPFPSKPSLLCLFRPVVCEAISCSVRAQMKKIPNIMTLGNCKVISCLMTVRLMTFVVVNGIGFNGPLLQMKAQTRSFMLLEGIWSGLVKRSTNF